MFNCRKCQQKQLDFRVTERKFLLQRFCFTALVAAWVYKTCVTCEGINSPRSGSKKKEENALGNSRPELRMEVNSSTYNLRPKLNPILHGGGVKSTPPGGLSYANPRGMPRMNWFFMTLFLSILERSWVGHFCDFFLKIPKNFTSKIFSIHNPKGGPFSAGFEPPSPAFFLSFFWVKNGNNLAPNA